MCLAVGWVPSGRARLEAGDERRAGFHRDSGRDSAPRVSYRIEIEVGGCTDCVLAATTAAAVSAILEREHTKAKESIVNLKRTLRTTRGG